MKIAYFDMFSGVSGDMILGALADCGVPLEVLKETAGDLGLKDVKINLSRGEIQGIAAVKIDIESGETHSHRSFTAIRDMIRKSALAEEVKETAVKIFQRLGEAEARVHGVELEKIHFHEVGAVDSIVDIVGAVAAFCHLGIKKYYAGAFRVGSGFVEIAHGRLPLPVPATVELIEGCPVERTQVQAELTTPTGAAIVSTLVRKEDFLPAGPFTFNSVGYGQGTRRLADRPNLLRIALGEEAESLKDTQAAVMLECNIDDMNPQYYGYLMDQLFEAGALDVFFTPVQMKKNRPGIMLQVLTDNVKLQDLARIILTESTTIGVRYHGVNRIVLARETKEVETPWGNFHIKVVTLPDGSRRARPEFKDLRQAAQRTGLPLLKIAGRLDAYLNKTES